MLLTSQRPFQVRVSPRVSCKIKYKEKALYEKTTTVFCDVMSTCLRLLLVRMLVWRYPRLPSMSMQLEGKRIFIPPD